MGIVSKILNKFGYIKAGSLPMKIKVVPIGKVAFCALPSCGKLVKRFSNRGRSYKYCSPECDKIATGIRLQLALKRKREAK